MKLASGKQSGFSILSVLVAIGLAGTIALIFASQSKNVTDQVKIINDKADVEDLRRLVRISLNCSATMASGAGSCTGSAPVTLKVSASKDLIEPSGSTVGKYVLRALCTSRRGVFDVEYRRDNASTWRPLFQAGTPAACPVP